MVNDKEHRIWARISVMILKTLMLPAASSYTWRQESKAGSHSSRSILPMRGTIRNMSTSHPKDGQLSADSDSPSTKPQMRSSQSDQLPDNSNYLKLRSSTWYQWSVSSVGKATHIDTPFCCHARLRQGTKTKAGNASSLSLKQTQPCLPVVASLLWQCRIIE